TQLWTSTISTYEKSAGTMYLLDSNACIHVLNGTSREVVARFSNESPSTVCLCAVVKAELLYGARKSRSVAKVLRNLERFFAPLVSLPFDDDCAHQYGLLRADLARSGRPIGANDLMIAAIARRHDLTVVTHNVGEFSRVVGLRVEDWESPS
ncbi:type II toxin-antitoxin system VapC family toxin, partial [Planctomycetota bacterium]